MTILFAGGELDAFVQPNGSSLGVNTSTSYYDPDFSSCACNATESLPLVAPLVTPISEMWAHAVYRPENSSSTTVLLQVRSSNGQGVVRISSNNGTLQFQYWNGSSWTNIGASFSPSGLNQVDVHVKIADSGGMFELYYNGILAASYTGDTNLFSGANCADFWMGSTWNNSSFPTRWSQVILTDTTDTRAMKLATIRPNGAGTTDQWTGSYTDVDEVGIFNDSDYISSGTPNQVELFTMTDLSPTAQTLDVLAFVMTGRARRGAAGPQNLQAAVRTSGTDYFSGNLPALSPAFNSLTPTIWELNPATSAPWSISDIQGIEAGFKSIA